MCIALFSAVMLNIYFVNLRIFRKGSWRTVKKSRIKTRMTFRKTNVLNKIEFLIYGSPDSRVIINVMYYLIFIEMVCVSHTKLQNTELLKLIFFLLQVFAFTYFSY
jgi:hypothetical protein